jgi:solute carrier family 25 carnitine/acylcarnitine transporter 20/29
VVDCVRSTLRISGARGPFQGLSATLLRNAPANSVYLGSFEVSEWVGAGGGIVCTTHQRCVHEELTAVAAVMALF